MTNNELAAINALSLEEVEAALTLAELNLPALKHEAKAGAMASIAALEKRQRQLRPNPNENCLEGMQCPHCGDYGPFKIEVRCIVTMHDDGTDDYDDTNWDGDSYCRCMNCGEEATVKAFREEGEESPQLNLNLSGEN